MRFNMSTKNKIPSNPRAIPAVWRVMEYLSEISGEKMLTGQHTQTLAMEELSTIQRVTGKEPALLGFELLSYSPNINYLDTDEECMKEVTENFGTLKCAWDWAAKKGLITFTWHWFSPLYGHGKSFFSNSTEYDAAKAVEEGTKEHIAFRADMDVMAGILRPFAEAGIPILWRPFHEAEGDWFWWNAAGSEVVKKLYRMMYHRFTQVHHLDNLIWVWNSPRPQDYPGDDVVDVISRDLYPDKHDHTSLVEKYKELTRITGTEKIAALAEVGTLPDADAVHQDKAEWTWYMTWSKGFCTGEEFTTHAHLKKVYDSPYTVTREELPDLY